MPEAGDSGLEQPEKENVLGYESTDPHAVIWEEAAEELRISLPCPPQDKQQKGCAIAIFVIGLVLMGPIVIGGALALITGPADPTRWTIGIVVEAIAVGVLWYVAQGIRQANRPPVPVTPSVITIRDGVLKIEQTGVERDTDVSWEVAEIRDIRLCPTTEQRVILGPRSALKAALFSAPDLVRISVLLPSEEVEDVVVRAPGKAWIEPLEGELREHLKLVRHEEWPV